MSVYLNENQKEEDLGFRGLYEKCSDMFEKIIEREDVTENMVMEAFLGMLESYNEELSNDSF